ncbi:MAG: cyclophilin-like fold protein [Mycobacterium sp.]
MVAAAVVAACGSPSTGHANDTASTTSRPGQEDSVTRLRLTAGGASATALLYDKATARDFASLLPLSITVHDLGGREKAGTLPRELAGGHGQNDYRAGQIGYWSPSHDLAIYWCGDPLLRPKLKRSQLLHNPWTD